MPTEIIDTKLIKELEKIQDPQELLKVLFTRFGKRAAIGTSGQLTGVVLIDMACRAKVAPRIFTIDTLRLFKETYELFDEIEEKYKVTVERYWLHPGKLQEMVQKSPDAIQVKWRADFFGDFPDRHIFGTKLFFVVMKTVHDVPNAVYFSKNRFALLPVPGACYPRFSSSAPSEPD